MSLSFSIDALVGSRSSRETRTPDSDHESPPDQSSASDKVSAFSPPTSRHSESNPVSSQISTYPPNLPLSQSWQDVIIPHLQIAAGNPFLGFQGAGIPGTGLDFRAGKTPSPTAIQELVQRNALAAFHHQRQNPVWHQQWMELIQQASGQNHGRFFQGPSEAPHHHHPGIFLQPFRKPKRIRTAFSPTQLLQLEDSFENNHYVVGAERKQLAQRLQLTETQVKVWFQNRRTKHKRVKTEQDAKKNPSHSSLQKLEKTAEMSSSTLQIRQKIDNSGESKDPKSDRTD